MCPLGKEYPVAVGTACLTAIKEGSLTQGLGTRKVIFKVWTKRPELRKEKHIRYANRLFMHQYIEQIIANTKTSSPNQVKTRKSAFNSGVRIPSRNLRKSIQKPPLIKFI